MPTPKRLPTLWEKATALLSLLRDSLSRLLSSILGTSSPTTTKGCEKSAPPPLHPGKPKAVKPTLGRRGMQIIPVYWDPLQRRFREEAGERLELTRVGGGRGSASYSASGATAGGTESACAAGSIRRG